MGIIHIQDKPNCNTLHLQGYCKAASGMHIVLHISDGTFYVPKYILCIHTTARPRISAIRLVQLSEYCDFGYCLKILWISVISQ